MRGLTEEAVKQQISDATRIALTEGAIRDYLDEKLVAYKQEPLFGAVHMSVKFTLDVRTVMWLEVLRPEITRIAKERAVYLEIRTGAYGHRSFWVMCRRPQK